MARHGQRVEIADALNDEQRGARLELLLEELVDELAEVLLVGAVEVLEAVLHEYLVVLATRVRTPHERVLERHVRLGHNALVAPLLFHAYLEQVDRLEQAELDFMI